MKDKDGIEVGAEIEAEHRLHMNQFAQFADHYFNQGKEPKSVGFALLLFNFGEPGRCNYISNCDRADMIKAMREFLARATGQLGPENPLN